MEAGAKRSSEFYLPRFNGTRLAVVVIPCNGFTTGARDIKLESHFITRCWHWAEITQREMRSSLTMWFIKDTGSARLHIAGRTFAFADATANYTPCGNSDAWYLGMNEPGALCSL